MQLMSTLLERLGTVEDPRVLVSLRFVPSAWFASLPNLVANGAEPAMLGLFALGLLVLAITGAYALQRLAPVYEEAIARVGAVSAPAEKPESRSRRLQDLFARVVVRHPMACTGFEFFLANLRGDRRVKIALLPNVGLPLALLLYAFATGETRDPYARDTRPQTSIAAPAPGPEGPAEHTATHRSARPDRLYAPVYVLALLGAAMSRMISTSASWKAAWIFHIAPLRRFDRFYSGVLWGVVYGLMLPAVILLGLSLLLAWHDPLHVSAHLALPFGLALLVFAFSSSIDPAPPFSRESRPHARTGEIVLSMLLAIPTVIVGIVHYRMRQHPLQLVLVGALMIGVALCAWMLAGRRIRNAIGKHPFEG
jgi:hypothetical protein